MATIEFILGHGAIMTAGLVSWNVGHAIYRRFRTGVRTHAANEAVIGYRAWGVVACANEDAALRSVFVREIWMPGQAMRGEPRHDNQGVHAFKSIEDARTQYPGMEAYGSVALAGTIVEHQNGYRAEYAYPVNVEVADRDAARAIARTYGCETSIASGHRTENDGDRHAMHQTPNR